ncbi:MAG: response regulator [Gammaproteobacteria bacterium]|nr:response regulator [Gammaproteobacteria bacterium]
MRSNIKLLVVDDSKVMRDVITGMFSQGSNIEVIAEATNGMEAVEATALYKPDVITMDVSMPVMDGITALKHIMIKTPTPTLMLSSLTMEGARVAFEALRFGAVDFISKPSALIGTGLDEQRAEIRSKIEYAAAVELEAIKYIREITVPRPRFYGLDESDRPDRVIAIGAAEGGYGALLKIIPYLPADVPFSYLVTMYATGDNVDSFVSYLDQFSSVQIKRAANNEILKPGVCYLNSGLDYMTVHHQADDYQLHVNPAPFASRNGAIDMLLFSCAEVIAENCTAVVLSGSLSDGAEGMSEVFRMGGSAIAQDQGTSLFKTMPGSAHDRTPGSICVADKHIASAINTIHLEDGLGISLGAV